MTDYKLYPNLPPTVPPENPQVAYHLCVIQAKMQGLKNKEQMFRQKCEKYAKILNRLRWLNACSSITSVATGISNVATFAIFIRLPVSVALGAASVTGAIASGIISTLTKTYQKKLKKVTKLTDIVTPALVIFERVLSGAMKNGIIDEEEFNTLQMLHLETLNKLTGVDRKIKAEHRTLVEKSLMEEIKELKKNQGTSIYLLALFVISYVTLKMDKICYQPNHLWKGQKAVKKLRELSGEKPKTVKQWLS